VTDTYDYADERKHLFTPVGFHDLLKVRDKAEDLLCTAGCFTAGFVMSVDVADTWTVMACLDYLKETGELTEVIPTPGRGWAQDRLFLPGRLGRR
jgi:hypothetical protein